MKKRHDKEKEQGPIRGPTGLSESGIECDPQEDPTGIGKGLNGVGCKIVGSEGKEVEARILQ